MPPPAVSPVVSRNNILNLVCTSNIQKRFQKSGRNNILLINNDSPALPSFWTIQSSGRFSSYHP